MSATVRHARPLRLGLLLGVLACALLTGCGGGAARGQRDQQAVLAYEQRIGDVNAAAAARPAQTPTGMVSRLREIVGEYRAVDAPPVMRRAHALLLHGLRAQLHGAQSGLRATTRGDAGGVHAAQRRIARGRDEVTRALTQIADRAGRCRKALADCSPAAPAGGGGG